MRLTRKFINDAWTATTVTNNFLHLQHVPRYWTDPKRVKRPVKATRASDRIKYWNIVPGDQIRIRGDASSNLREVFSINRFTNRVAIRMPAKSDTDASAASASKSIHYCRAQLFVGNYEFANDEGEKPKILPVFAKRLATSSPYWNKYLHRYDWTRVATKTDPIIPYLKESKIPIPWPKPDKPLNNIPTANDTPKDIVSKVTYRPPLFAPSEPTPVPPSEFDYLRALYNPKLLSIPHPSVEVYLVNELSNPHSRAKKQARWQAYHSRTKAMLQEFTDIELKNLQGRPIAEAKAEALWRWREKIEADKKLDKKKRWKTQAAVEKVTRKNLEKAKRERKQRDKLTAMVLEPGQNQVIPPDMFA